MTSWIELVDDPGPGNSRIIIDAIVKLSLARVPTKPFEQGAQGGAGVVETSGASMLKIRFTGEINSIDGGKTALELWNDLDDLVALYNDEQMTLSITFNYQPVNKTITFVGKPAGGVLPEFTKGDPEQFTFSMGFSVEDKGPIA